MPVCNLHFTRSMIASRALQIGYLSCLFSCTFFKICWHLTLLLLSPMTLTHPGTFVLCCWACLNHIRPVDEEEKLGNVDAQIFTSRKINHTSMVSCSLWYCQGGVALHNSIYNIIANMWVFTYYSLSSLITLWRSWPIDKWFLQSWTLLHTERQTKALKWWVTFLMSVSSCSHMLFCWLFQWEQFKAVPVLAEDPVSACMIPVRITASGMVASVDKDCHSFILFPTQTVTACLDPQNLPVCAVLEKGLKWPNPVARLPSAYNFVAFTGKLAYFKDDVGPIQSNMHFHAVVLRSSWTLGLTWAGRLRPSHFARCERSFCFKYSVRAPRLWQYRWYVVTRAWEISQAYEVVQGSLWVLHK